MRILTASFPANVDHQVDGVASPDIPLGRAAPTHQKPCTPSYRDRPPSSFCWPLKALIRAGTPGEP